MAQPRPVGMRIPRPYDTEDDFIRGDGLAIGRLGMILIGAPKRPPGITIRFEVLLRDGSPVFRGEGRVVAHRIHANGREGLEIRFTRLDSRSKGLVEQVLKLRRSGALTPISATNPPPAMESEDAPRKPGRLVRSVPPEAMDAEQPEDAAQEADEAATVDPAIEPEMREAGPVEECAAALEATSDGEPTQDNEGEERVTLASSHPDEDVRQTEAPVPPVEMREAEELADIEEEVHEEVVVDEDPTPFAPPVMLDVEHHEAPAAPSIRKAEPPPPPAVEVSPDVAAALAKLRDRAGAFDAPQTAGALLERLRARAKAG